MAVVYIEPRPKGRPSKTLMKHYAVETGRQSAACDFQVAAHSHRLGQRPRLWNLRGAHPVCRQVESRSLAEGLAF
jgi:hypothetical protein